MKPASPVQYTEPNDDEKAAIGRLLNDESYKHAVDWLIAVTGLRDLSYRSESPLDTAFAEGKRFVGLQLVRAAKLPFKREAEAPPKRKR